MRQGRLGEARTYFGKTARCGKCGRSFRARASSKNGKGMATVHARWNRDRHEAACGRAPRARRRDLVLPPGVRPLEAFPG